MAASSVDVVEVVENGGIGLISGIGVGMISQAAASLALPTIMSSTGTVVAGVGTIHGATTATLAVFAASPVVVPVLGVVGVAAGVGYALGVGECFESFKFDQPTEQTQEGASVEQKKNE